MSICDVCASAIIAFWTCYRRSRQKNVKEKKRSLFHLANLAYLANCAKSASLAFGRQHSVVLIGWLIVDLSSHNSVSKNFHFYWLWCYYAQVYWCGSAEDACLMFLIYFFLCSHEDTEICSCVFNSTCILKSRCITGNIEAYPLLTPNEFNCSFLQSQSCCLLIFYIQRIFLKSRSLLLKLSFHTDRVFLKAVGWFSLQPPSQTCYHATASKCLAQAVQQAGARQARRWRGGQNRLWERCPSLRAQIHTHRVADCCFVC